jgi:sugar phosphate isomerase/epimerase
MELADHVIGVCSWSLKCADNRELVEALKKLRLCHVQLALGSLLDAGVPAIDETLQLFEKECITLTAGMIGFPGEDYSTIASIRGTGGYMPDDKWDERRRITESAAKIAQRLRLPLLSTHIGFVPGSNESGYETMVERLRLVADLFKEHGLTLLMETGQEAATELLQFLNDVSRANVAVNFDPANMLLYGSGNPVDAVRILGRHVQHVHIKDAVCSTQPGTRWGEEVAFGRGQVNAQAFLTTLRSGGYRGPLVIEREAGSTRMADVQHAIGVLESVLRPRPSADGE